MALTRLFVDATLAPGQVLTLASEQANYLGRALRLRSGDSLTVFNAEQGEFQATVQRIGKAAADVLVGQSLSSSIESPLRVHLVQGVSRGERMDFVVQKATELGVKRITPVLTEYGMVKLDAARADKRREHWQKVAISACEQCGRTRPPLIDPPLRLKAWFGERPRESDRHLILRPGATAPLAAVSAPQTKICLLIGPEGGFSETEYSDAEVSGFTAVSLGPRILRTETAAVAAVAILQSLWGDLAGS